MNTMQIKWIKNKISNLEMRLQNETNIDKQIRLQAAIVKYTWRMGPQQ